MKCYIWRQNYSIYICMFICRSIDEYLWGLYSKDIRCILYAESEWIGVFRCMWCKNEWPAQIEDRSIFFAGHVCKVSKNLNVGRTGGRTIILDEIRKCISEKIERKLIHFFIFVGACVYTMKRKLHFNGELSTFIHINWICIYWI